MNTLKSCLLFIVIAWHQNAEALSRNFLERYCLFESSQTPTFEDSICAMLNAVRMNPKEVAAAYEQSWFYSPTDPNDQSLLATLQSSAAIEKPLVVDTVLSKIARCHALSSGHQGHVGHDRIANCSENFDAECLCYGLNGAIFVLIELLEDHGVRNLDHRKILLSEEYSRIGAAHTAHLKYRHGSVIDMGK